MAKKRGRPAKAAKGQGRTAGRRRQAARRRAPSAAVASGAREARRDDLARQVEAQPGPRLVAWDGGSEEGKERPVAEAAVAGGAGVPDYARYEPPRHVQPADPQGGREPAWPAEGWHAERSNAPGISEIGIELALGALRLFRTVVTAPIRLALTFLRPREA